MSDDIVNELREWAPKPTDMGDPRNAVAEVMLAAADEIERLAASQILDVRLGRDDQSLAGGG